jgi:outer membrane receptor protein involved in Fe transport
MKSGTLQFVWVTFAAIASTLPLQSQTATSTVLGTIADSTRAVIPNVAVRITNSQTGLTRQTVTDSVGNYSFPALPPGVYTVEAEAQGFRRERVSELALQVNQTARVDFSLQPGTVSESIEVFAVTSLLNTDTATVSQVIENKRIIELPLNKRQFLDLALLTPGVTLGNGGPQSGSSTLFARPSANSSVSVNGQRSQNNNFLLDGVLNTDGDVNAFIVTPSIDAVQEFRVETSNYSAEFGRSSGAQINVVSKSGTNQFHGSVYEFLRNSALDARPFSNPGKLPDFRFNQYGFAIGGPVRTDQTFFLLNYEGLRSVQGQSAIASVPLARQRTGDFSALRAIYDPDTLAPDPTDATGRRMVRAQFPNNTIPLERIDPIALRMLRDFVPLPNLPGNTNNLIDTRSQRQRNNQEGLRLDQRIGSGGNLFGRYTLSNETGFIPSGLPGSGAISRVRGHHAALGETHSVRPNIVNEARFGFARLALGRVSENAYKRDIVTEIGLRGVQFAGPEVWGVPSMTVPGYTTMGDDNFFLPMLLRDNTFQWLDTLSIIAGRHTIKVGGELRRFQFNITQLFTPRGDIRFNANYTTRFAGTGGADPTGDALASFLLGLPVQQRRTVGNANAYLRQLAYSGFVQDDWKISQRLTMNLGLRYEFTSPFSDKYDRLANISFKGIPPLQEIAAGNQLGKYALPIVLAGQNGTPRGLTTSDRNNWAPRVGLAWRPGKDNTWVIRSAVGVFFGATDGEHVGRTTINLPFVLGEAQNSDTFIPSIRGIGFTVTPAIGGNTLRQSFIGLDENLRTPYSIQWNFAIQRALTQTIVAEVGYVGSQSHKLDTRNAMNDPVAAAGDVDSRRFFQRMVLPEASTLQGIDLPAPLVGREIYAGTIEIQANRVNANYHGLQSKIEKRFSKGFSMLGSYTWSKAISDGNSYRRQGSQGELAQDFLNNSERALTGFDVRHRVVSNVLYEVPFCGKGTACFAGRVGRALLGGWQVNGIVQAQSGFPFTALLASATANNGRATRPNIVAGVSPYVPENERSATRWLNPAAFALPAPFTIGNSGVNNLIGPGMSSVDCSLLKNTSLTERSQLQFRAEFFNILNHVSYGNPNAQVGSNQFGTITTQSVTPRQIQFGMKLLF